MRRSIVSFLAFSWLGDTVVSQLVTIDVVGEENPRIGWADSYFAEGKCWCWRRQTFAEGMRDIVVPTVDGQWWTLPDVCKALGRGPPTVIGTTPVYNDIQCGRGPPAIARDEQTCPGRVDSGREGCGDLGPYWDFSEADLSNVTNRVLPRPADAHRDVLVVIDIIGEQNPRINWGDSYSVGDQCFCSSNFDHGMDIVWTNTPNGYMLVKEVCDMLGPGPGIVENETPVYNDVQCGNGPANNAGDEQRCPGRVDIGRRGCGHIGPKWNFDKIGESTSSPTALPTQTPVSVRTPSPVTKTSSPTAAPSATPTATPKTVSPTAIPSVSPSSMTTSPSSAPISFSPTVLPTTAIPSSPPSFSPVSFAEPSGNPVKTGMPTTFPSEVPSASMIPSQTKSESMNPSQLPSTTMIPSQSMEPSPLPSESEMPSQSMEPSPLPSESEMPSLLPSESEMPSEASSSIPSSLPSGSLVISSARSRATTTMVTQSSAAMSFLVVLFAVLVTLELFR